MPPRIGSLVEPPLWGGFGGGGAGCGGGGGGGGYIGKFNFSTLKLLFLKF